MRKVTNILFFIFLGIVLTQDLVECVLFLLLLFLLVLITVVISGHVRRYLSKRRFRKECEDLFTEEFYTKLNNVIQNEFK